MDEFKFELDKSINMGKITDNDFKESKSISLIRDILEKNNKIKVRTNEADKIPDLDGRISILDQNKHDRIIIEVQSKTLPEEYCENNPYHYDCDTKVLNVVKYNKSFNPVVLFLSDINGKKLFYKIITKEYLKEINFDNQETKRIKFDNSDLYEEDKFIKEVIQYAKKLTLIINSGEDALVTSYINGPNEYYALMQNEIDKLNYRFDHELKMIKDYLFPNVWKFGIAYNKTENGFSLGLYKIYKGDNDTLVKNFNFFNIFDGYMLTTFSNDNSNISNVLNNWIDKCINEFYNSYILLPKYCCNDILSEILFDFLDNMTYLSRKVKSKEGYNYYKNTESIDIIHSYVNGLTKFYKKIWSEKDKYEDAKILEPAYNKCKKFIIFNPFVSFQNCQELLEECIFEKNVMPFKENIFLNNNVNMDLVILSIIELEKRGISAISRINSKDNKNFIENIFTRLEQSYNFTKENLGLNDKQIIKGKFIVYHFDEKQDEFCVKYCNNDQLVIIYKKESMNRYKEIRNNEDQHGFFNEFRRIKYPLYNMTRLLINKGCMEAQGLEFDFIPESLDIFNMRDFPILALKNK